MIAQLGVQSWYNYFDLCTQVSHFLNKQKTKNEVRGDSFQKKRKRPLLRCHRKQMELFLMYFHIQYNVSVHITLLLTKHGAHH